MYASKEAQKTEELGFHRHYKGWNNEKVILELSLQ